MTFKGSGAGSGPVSPSASESPKEMGSSRFKRLWLGIAGDFSLPGAKPAQK